MGILKRIIGLGIAGLIVLALFSGGLWAFFSDTETATTNQVTAGTLDLTTNDANGVTGTITTTTLRPGKSVDGTTITLKNIGSRTSATLDITFNYTESDGATNPGANKTADEVAAILEVTVLEYAGLNMKDLSPTSYANKVDDINGNGYIDVYDLKNDPVTGLEGLNPSGSYPFDITIRMRAGISDDFRGDGVNITATFTLNQ